MVLLKKVQPPAEDASIPADIAIGLRPAVILRKSNCAVLDDRKSHLWI